MTASNVCELITNKSWGKTSVVVWEAAYNYKLLKLYTEGTNQSLKNVQVKKKTDRNIIYPRMASVTKQYVLS